MSKRTIALVLLIGVLTPLALAARERPRTALFQIVLLSSSASPSNSAERLPPDVGDIIGTVRDLLPLSGLRLLDSCLVRSNEAGRVKMKGPWEGLEVQFRFDQSPEEDSVFFRHFAVNELRSTGAQPNFSTSFATAPGRTVVVGSTMLTPEESLVVLLRQIEKDGVGERQFVSAESP